MSRDRRRAGPPATPALIALQFLTRIPLRLRRPPTAAELARSVAIYPAVGALVGVLVGGVASALVSASTPAFLAIAIALVAGLLLTGALHEDGLADTADGLGGGRDRDQALAIMRDSRIGSYGVLALISLMGLRGAALVALPPTAWMAALVVAGTTSRWSATLLLIALPYARREEVGAAALMMEELRLRHVALATALSAGIVGAVAGARGVLVGVAVAAVTGLAGAYFRQRIQGVTGDCLGAAVAVTEVAALLAFLWAGHALPG